MAFENLGAGGGRAGRNMERLFNELHGAGDQGDEQARQDRQRRAVEYQGEEDARIGRQQSLDNRRNSLLSTISSVYGDPRRADEREQAYQASLRAGTESAKLGWQNRSRSAGIAAARRGMLGANSTLEGQGRIDVGYQGDILDAEQSAEETRRRAMETDAAQLTNIRRAILSGDVGSAQSLLAGLRSQDATTGNLARLFSRDTLDQMQSWDQAQQQSQMYGQAIGAVGQGIASQVGGR